MPCHTACPALAPAGKVQYDAPAPQYSMDDFVPLECSAGTLVLLHVSAGLWGVWGGVGSVTAGNVQHISLFRSSQSAWLRGRRCGKCECRGVWTRHTSGLSVAHGCK